MYEKGEGVAREPVKAYAWADVAASRLPEGPERKRITANRDRVAATLKPDEKRKADAYASELKTRLAAQGKVVPLR